MDERNIRVNKAGPSASPLMTATADPLLEQGQVDGLELVAACVWITAPTGSGRRRPAAARLPGPNRINFSRSLFIEITLVNQIFLGLRLNFLM